MSRRPQQRKAVQHRRERLLALAVAATVLILPVAALGQAATNFGSASGIGCPHEIGDPNPGDNIICNGSVNFLTTELFFEPETPFSSLKGLPNWNELEQLLDNPYAVTTSAVCNDAAGHVPNNDQGFPSYCTDPSVFVRRPAFGVSLPPMLVHPLNQNPATGAEMRLLNPRYRGGSFDHADVCYTLGTACIPPSKPIVVSSGAPRVLDTEIDYDIAIGRKMPFCQINPEPVPLNAPFNTSFDSESLTACGSDPGEPGAISHLVSTLPDNLGFPNPANGPINVSCSLSSPPCNSTSYSLVERFVCILTCAAAQSQPMREWYSTPAVPGVTREDLVIPASARLWDPGRGGNGFIQARNPISGNQGLRKPSIRVPEAGGNGLTPNYLANSASGAGRPEAVGDPTGADLLPSSENDYVGLLPSNGVTQANYRARKEAARREAMTLGKSLFWDMQVGSDAVQSCGSCHAHAGADNRTKNQINPNGQDGIQGPPTDYLANQFTFQPNYMLTAADFPFHGLADPEVAGDPACGQPINGDVTGITFPDGAPPDHPRGAYTACAKTNIVSDTDDVASSMGVKFGRFLDIPPIGTLGPESATGHVRSVVPDLRSFAIDPKTGLQDSVDPIDGFQGKSPHGSVAEFRRVEPRNTPTIFLADVNFDNFWDGRARHDDNGGSVFGAADPQAHIWVDQGTGLTATRQLIKYSSLASLAKGPALSKFEMSYDGRNWAKIGKKLLQAGVTPLANQLVDPTDSLLGRYSNQGGAECAGLPDADRSVSYSPPGNGLQSGKPGLCISYSALIRRAYYPALWQNTTQHLDGCYTDGRPDIHPNQCGTGGYPAANVAVLEGGAVASHNNDPFDGYALNRGSGAAVSTDTNQFTQMEANFSLFWGQSIHLWASMLVPDNTPWDQWLDLNPDSGFNIGETGEPLLVLDLPNCVGNRPGAEPPGYVRDSLHPACFVELGNFKRDNNSNLRACIAEETINGVRVCTSSLSAPGTRQAADPDPLLGMDIFFGSNVSLKNPNFRSARCGACHNAPTLTDHTVPFTVKAMLVDPAPEFEKSNPVIEPLMEPLGHQRIISGFLLESEINGPGQDAIERKIINESIVPAPVVANNGNCITDNCSGYSFPDAITLASDMRSYVIHSDLGSGPVAGPGTPVPFTSFGGSFFDNGVYNIGVRPCVADQVGVTGACEDVGRGGTDAFGWPLSLAALLMKNLGGPAQQPGSPIAQFDPSFDPSCAPYCSTGGLWEPTGHDPQINPGFADEEANPLLPTYLRTFASRITVGDAHPQLDEACGPVGGCINTLSDVANAEGFPEIPFDPRADLSEVINNAVATGDSTIGGKGDLQQGTWPMVNRVARFGSFKAPQIREAELTGPYFHNGGKLTLRQVVDFYVRGGDFPVTNSHHRDFNILNLNAELQSDLSEEEKVALVDFLLELTDDRVRFERAPFDHPQVIIPFDGTAFENTGGREAMLTGCSALTDPAQGGGPGRRTCAGGMFIDVPATGSTGNSVGPIPNFMGIAGRAPDPSPGVPGKPIKRLLYGDAFCKVADSQYCH